MITISIVLFFMNFIIVINTCRPFYFDLVYEIVSLCELFGHYDIPSSLEFYKCLILTIFPSLELHKCLLINLCRRNGVRLLGVIMLWISLLAVEVTMSLVAAHIASVGM